MTRLLLAIGLLLASALSAASKTLDIYWADVEGGAATLIVTPAGESLLVDTGNPRPDDRDAKRAFEAAKLAGLSKIDYLLITHFHGDHVGGLESLLKMIPIGKFLDHGDSVEDNAGWKTYLKLSEGKRQSVKPGDRIPLKGVDIRVVAAHGAHIAKPINGGGANAAVCKDAQLGKPDPTDNAQSAGFLLSMGKFQFLDLGDLTWNKEHALVCPQNLLGHDRSLSGDAPWPRSIFGAATGVVGETAGGGDEQRPAQRRPQAGVRHAEEIAGHSGCLAGALVRGFRQRAKLARADDREHDSDGGVQGSLDEGVGRVQWQVHGHQWP